MQVSISASGSPSATRASVESQIRTAGDSNPACRATLREIARHIIGCIDDDAESVSVSGSFGFYVGNTMPSLPTIKAPGQALPSSGAPAAAATGDAATATAVG